MSKTAQANVKTIEAPNLEQVGRWRQALYETGRMTHEGNKMGGGELASLYNWLASIPL